MTVRRASWFRSNIFRITIKLNIMWPSLKFSFMQRNRQSAWLAFKISLTRTFRQQPNKRRYFVYNQIPRTGGYLRGCRKGKGVCVCVFFLGGLTWCAHA
jgi:hypothetical protein